MPETRTDWVLNAQAKGFEQAQRKAGQLTDTAQKALSEQVKGFREQNRVYKEAQREIRGLERDLQSLARRQLLTNNAIAGTERGTAKYKALKKEIKEIGDEAGRVQKQMQLLERAFQKPLQAKGSFTQGMLQGAIPQAAFLQRGPGMFRQAAGAAIGGRARQMAGGFGRAPFSGIGGVQEAVGGIPFVGGLLSGQVGQATELAGRGLNMRRIESQVAAQFGLASGGAQRRAAMDQAGRAAVQRAEQKAAGGVTDDEVRARAERTLNQEMGGGRLGRSFGRAALPEYRMKAARTELEREAAAGIDTNRITREARSQAASDFRRGPLERFRGIGQQFGMQDTETLQLMGNIARAGGGAGDQTMKGAETFLAADRLGIGADVSGAFAGGVRRGGLAGGGDADARLEKSFQKAIKRGLSETEAIQYLQDMAAGINQWRTTGIPLNEGAFNTLARGAGAIGPVRAGAVAGQVKQGFQNIAQGGVQSALDLQLLQQVGGFKGGGLGELSGALESLENLDKLDPQQFSKLVQTFAGRAGGDDMREQALFVRQGLNKLGANVSLTEANLLTAQATGREDELTTAQKRQGRRVRRRVRQGEGTLKERARAQTPEELKKQAEIEDRKTRAGEGVIGATQDLENATTKTAKGVVEALGGSFAELAKWVDTSAGSFKKIVELVDALDQ